MDFEDEFSQESDFKDTGEDYDDDYDMGMLSLEDEDEDAALTAGAGASPDSTGHLDYPYEVLSAGQIVEKMTESIEEVQLVMEMSNTLIRKLLTHFKWDKDKLLDRFYGAENVEELYKEANITVGLIKNASSQGPASSHPAEATCEICCLNIDKTEQYGLACDHLYCIPCWKEYLYYKIMSDGVAQNIECPGCPTPVEDQMVLNLLEDQKVKQRYQHLITNSFVECNRLMQWCSTPDCNSAIQVSYVQAEVVKCNCGNAFCFACSKEWHAPLECELYRKWLKKCSDDTETATWIEVNTKECPKCKTAIEKNGGCNHMSCSKSSCKYHFCWICLGPWKMHDSYYECRNFKETEETKAQRTSIEQTKLALERYLFYRDRYMNHLQSRKFEKELHKKVQAKMEEMRMHNMSWIEVQFLQKAVDILRECRQTLMYTYAFAFYLGKSSQTEIFKINQNNLENATEELSGLLEREISAESVRDIKASVLSLSSYCASRRQQLIDHVHEGYTNSSWVYNDAAK